ncbi:MAG: carboxypeptidase-like regulatory domain-containing protein [Sphingobacteriaceae bacterium]|nr:MAG: carboxypeptidase-like regulatory domain-containing protein [Sphingobacteriaceae bacterium]
MLHRIFYTLIAFLIISTGVNAQAIKGKVFDSTNGKPIPNASIYLNGSSKGTTSNEQGEFSLSTLETNIPLIVSCVGYQSETIINYTGKVLNVMLKPRTQELKEVVIGGMSREEQLKIFITQFIGSTSKDYIITNTDDIDFKYRKKTKTLEAAASQPLIIYNKIRLRVQRKRISSCTMKIDSLMGERGSL